MATLSSQSTVTITDAAALTEEQSFTLLPSNTGALSLRCLTYPDNTFAPIEYEQNPSKWTNFDTSPLVKRPSVGVQQTLEGNKITQWFGYDRDAAVTETWQGSDSEASISLSFFRELYTYYENPPVNSFIQWAPKDRTSNVYNIVIESLTVGGSEISLSYIPALNDCVVGDVVLRFRIVSQV